MHVLYFTRGFVFGHLVDLVLIPKPIRSRFFLVKTHFLKLVILITCQITSPNLCDVWSSAIKGVGCCMSYRKQLMLFTCEIPKVKESELLH